MVKIVATDIDGTITVDRSTTKVDLDAVKYMSLLEEKGVLVVLVSSNALPLVVGLKKYFGLKGPCIGESGSLVYFDGKVYSLTRITCSEAARELVEKFSSCIEHSWQNKFRIHDYALKVKKNCIKLIDEVMIKINDLLRNKYPCKASYSGYAIHITPIDVSKAKALRFITEKLGVDMDEVVAIGDSVMDIDMVKEAGLGVAVANADEELKSVADFVTSQNSSKGFIEVAKMILEGRI